MKCVLPCRCYYGSLSKETDLRELSNPVCWGRQTTVRVRERRLKGVRQFLPKQLLTENDVVIVSG